MENKRYEPLFDKMYWWIFAPTNALTVVLLVLAFFEPMILFITVPIFLFVNYFLLSPVFGYVELQDEGIFIRYGIIMKRYIPYSSVRAIERGRGVISESMMSLKNALEHVNVKYNSFDVTTVSVKDNAELCREVRLRAGLPE